MLVVVDDTDIFIHLYFPHQGNIANVLMVLPFQRRAVVDINVTVETPCSIESDVQLCSLKGCDTVGSYFGISTYSSEMGSNCYCWSHKEGSNAEQLLSLTSC